MSDPILHECGIGMIRLLKPLEYYYEKYGTYLWGLNKTYLLMQKQHNRGQDAFGLGCVKLNMPVGFPFMFRERSVDQNPLEHVFQRLGRQYRQREASGKIQRGDLESHRLQFPFAGELYLSHLRYGTHGDHSIHRAHPVSRRNNWTTKNLLIAGNFNMTNTPEMLQRLINFGQHPVVASDTQTVLEEIAYCLDEAYDKLRHELQTEDFYGQPLTEEISNRLDLNEVLRESSQYWDGGYVIGGLTGAGDAFVMRDPAGIRPCWYFQNDEVVAVASERAALRTVFNLASTDAVELKAGEALTIKKCGTVGTKSIRNANAVKPCSFERIYFSRGNDADIYKERKALGAALVPKVIEAIDNDIEHAVVGYIPNSGEIAYMGLVEGLEAHRRSEIKSEILDLQNKGELSEAAIEKMMDIWPRAEKVAIKDVKLRTFISRDDGRKDLVSHVYDVTHDIVNPDDSLIVLDDSIVRGTTMRESILRILARLNPKQIIVLSSAPQIRYPDCYGIDMSTMGEFVAFEAAVSLIRENGQDDLLKAIYDRCIEQKDKPADEVVNHVKGIYDAYSYEAIEERITQLVTPKDLEGWSGNIRIIYQSLEGLHKAIPNYSGDWYFTGEYPTPGGYKVLNRAFINYYENNNQRSY